MRSRADWGRGAGGRRPSAGSTPGGQQPGARTWGQASGPANFHLGALEGVVEALPLGPVDAVGVGEVGAPQVEAIEVGEVAASEPEGSRGQGRAVLQEEVLIPVEGGELLAAVVRQGVAWREEGWLSLREGRAPFPSQRLGAELRKEKQLLQGSGRGCAQGCGAGWEPAVTLPGPEGKGGPRGVRDSPPSPTPLRLPGGYLPRRPRSRPHRGSSRPPRR